MTRNISLTTALAITGTILLSTGVAMAAQRQIAESGSWRSIVADQGAGRVCYAIAVPKERLPATLKRDPGYAFATLKDGSWELSFDFGYRLANVEHSLQVDGVAHALFSKGSAAWVSRADDERKVIEDMKSGREMRAAAKSGRGNDTTDVYDLGGFTASLAALEKECGR